MTDEPPNNDDDEAAIDEAAIDEAEKVVRIARVLREADWPGYRDTDD